MSTILTYRAFPAAAAGIALTATGAAWTNPASYTQVMVAGGGGTTSTFYICAVTIMYPTLTLDTTVEVELELGIGAAAAETPIITIPFDARVDSAVGHQPVIFLVLPEPKEVAANTRVAARLRQSLAAATAWTGMKIMYLV